MYTNNDWFFEIRMAKLSSILVQSTEQSRSHGMNFNKLYLSRQKHEACTLGYIYF